MMNLPRWGSGRLAVFALALAACDQNTTETQAPEAPPTPVAQAETVAPPPAAIEVPAPIPPSTEVPVNSVDSVMLSRPEDAPNAMIIRVLGTAASRGWTLPRLEPMAEDSSGEAAVMSYQFVATSPEASDDANTASEQIEIELRVDGLSPDVTTIRIVAATNEVSAPIAQ